MKPLADGFTKNIGYMKKKFEKITEVKDEANHDFISANFVVC